MAQRYCPDCRQPIGLEEITDAQFEAQLGVHRGSKKCKAAIAQNAAAGYSPSADRLPYVVRFEAHKRLLNVRLSMAESRLTPGGSQVVTKPSRWARFKNYQYETRSLLELLALRDARNNGANIATGSTKLEVARLGINADTCPDRFWETGCFDPESGEEVDPKEYAAVAAMKEAAATEEAALEAIS